VNELDLSGKVALVTGASRGIGRGCAMEMAKVGADVIVNYCTHQRDAGEVVDEIVALGRRSTAIQADVATRLGVDNLMRGALEFAPTVDILVNNAYCSVRKPFLELSDEDVDATWRVTLWSVLRCSQAVARVLVQRQMPGSIIAISSTFAHIPWPTSLAYNVAKAGVEQMVFTMAAELAPFSIRVNAIEPGWTNTPGERKFSTEAQIADGATRLPLRRLGEPQDIGRMCAFLASEAASYVTGAMFRVDGGSWLPGGARAFDHMR
jgi:glucose 1-dehydrogenase